MTTDSELLDGLREAWAEIDTVLVGLAPHQWELATACPGWNVQAQVAHVLGFESAWFLGRDAADGAPSVQAMSALSHVHNDLGADNQRWVATRASHEPAVVLAEYREVVASRLTQLDGADLDQSVTTFRGSEVLRGALALRLFDTWVHLLDINLAVGRPPVWSTIGARHAIARMLQSMPYVAGRKAKLPEGTTAAVSLFGVNAQTTLVTVKDGRGAVVTAVGHQPVAGITMHEETFIRVTTGRLSSAEAIDTTKITLRGDQEIARTLATNLRVVEL